MWEGLAAGLIGAIVGGIGSYLLTRKQIDEARRVAGGELLIAFDSRLDWYQEVHEALRPNGAWARGGEIHDDVWPQIEGYMGAFERLNVLIEQGLVQTDIARRFYQYRLSNIVYNQKIRQYKLVNEKEHWKDFIDLCGKLEVRIP